MTSELVVVFDNCDNVAVSSLGTENTPLLLLQ